MIAMCDSRRKVEALSSNAKVLDSNYKYVCRYLDGNWNSVCVLNARPIHRNTRPLWLS